MQLDDSTFRRLVEHLPTVAYLAAADEQASLRWVSPQVESLLGHPPEDLADVVRRLADAGLGVAVDDFGRAHSSLGRLRDLPARWIKVDRAFLHGVPHDPRATALFTALLGLVEALEVEHVVEGVEDAAQRA